MENRPIKELYLLTGSNRGNRLGLLLSAVQELEIHFGPLQHCSEIYETAPWGFEDPLSFFNQVLVFKTHLPPLQILQTCLAIEKKMGRTRSAKPQTPYEGRLIDIDLLLYGDEVLEEPELTLPHPRMTQRRFTMIPLAQVAPETLHPVLKSSMKTLLQNCPDHSAVNRLLYDFAL